MVHSFSDGLLAVMQPLWSQQTTEISPMLERMAGKDSSSHAGLIWEGIAAQLTLLKQPFMAAFDLISLLTYRRLPESTDAEQHERLLAAACHIATMIEST